MGDRPGIWSNGSVHVCKIKTAVPLAVVMLCGGSASAQHNDWLIVPGKRLGPIRPDTTRADLERLFGKSNVRDQLVDTGDVGPMPGTAVFPTMPSRRLAIFWSESGTGEVAFVQICYQRQVGPCRWHTEDGVTLGTDLRTLEKLNGRAFQIEPWDYDAAGNISSWRGGKLANVFETEGTTWDGTPSRLWLTVEPRKGTDAQLRKLLNEVSRQRQASLSGPPITLVSDDPAVGSLHPAVTRITLVLPSKTHDSGVRAR